MRVELLHDCSYEINEDERWCRVTFGDGTEIVSTPNYNDESVARAESLGYTLTTPIGSDFSMTIVWEMTKDHDLLHMHLAQCDGLEHSPTLYGVATGNPVSLEEALAEERRVFAATRLMNLGREGLHS